MAGGSGPSATGSPLAHATTTSSTGAPRPQSWATFIVTYDRPAVLADTLEIVLAQTVLPDVVLVVDNGTDPGTEEVVRSLGERRIVYQRTGENLGSAGGVSFGQSWVAEHGYDWAHSIDDDDPPRTADTIERLRALVTRHAHDDRLGGVGSVGSRWDWRRGQIERIPDHELAGDLPVDVIGGNSNFTIRRQVIETIGPVERQFFFGFYDPLYCLRVAQAGYHLLIDGDLHRRSRELAGRLDLHRSRRFVPADPASGVWRRYYVTRNYIFRMRRSFDRPDLARREATRALGRSVGSWARGPRYGALYSAMQIRGIADGYRGKLGRVVEPRAKTTRDG